MRLYVFRLGTIKEIDAPIEGYLIQLDEGTNVLVDTGCTREMIDDDTAPFRIASEDHIVARLDSIGLGAHDVHQVICTHLHPDHCGGHEEFPHAEFVVQRRHLAEARHSGQLGYEWMRRHWEFPGQRWREVDGDTVLHPGVELIESSGHAPGHQSVFVCLPDFGSVLLAGDAIAHSDLLDPDTRTVDWHDHNEAEVRASTRKLVNLAERERVALIVHSHDRDQWPTLRHAPVHYH